MKTVYDFTVKDRKGNDISLKAFANEVLLIVNTATKCGFTPTYEELEATYKKYHSQGFEKIKVNGEDADPLYKFLKQQKGFAGWDEGHKLTPILDKMLSEADPNYKENPDIKWNFTKFLINKKGQVVARFEPTEKIENINKEIEKLLAE